MTSPTQGKAGPACAECGEPCIDAGPGLGWQCVSDKPHADFIVDDSATWPTAARATVARLQAELSAVSKECRVTKDDFERMVARNREMECLLLQAKASEQRLAEALAPMIQGTAWITSEQVKKARDALSARQSKP